MKKRYMGMSIYMIFIGFLFFNYGFDWNWHVAKCFDLVSAKVSVGLL